MSSRSRFSAPRLEWYGQIEEEVVDPGRRIIDPHHHLWEIPDADYVLDHLRADTGSGHRVTETVFVECHASYRTDGPEHLRPVGETEFVATIAEASTAGPDARIAGIVAHADLRLGAPGDRRLDEVLDAHEAAGHGLFRGIRHAISCPEHPETLLIPGRAPTGLAADEAFRAGVRRLGQRGLTYDSWHYHVQLPEFTDLCRAAPDTTVVLDHFGTPLGVGPYEGRRDEVFATWRDDLAELARCPNVMAKLGGLAMPDNGFGWHDADRPPTSDEVVAAHRPYFLHAIECFGPDRCMFESNFPVDRLSLSYRVLFNAFKKMVVDFSDAEQDAMFSGTAERVYRL
ncbi:MAG: amidohydrolase family protein [Actinomycetota bacterium]|nr:amidohydrolase family protein [Actinomycetota bacterium]MEC9424777.1 amidohydrolase family protein [Actinomycetota bacterium]MEC9467657.1 amidohydrolase family protein [Actinomycetota bacterium]MED5220989.1 amidohydrolase family protein [Actinomycetota bacterium]MED5232046.1 amidohydrolase family protein [Actinomycetota bacterium]